MVFNTMTEHTPLQACLRYIFELMEAGEYAELADYLAKVKVCEY